VLCGDVGEFVRVSDQDIHPSCSGHNSTQPQTLSDHLQKTSKTFTDGSLLLLYCAVRNFQNVFKSNIEFTLMKSTMFTFHLFNNAVFVSNGSSTSLQYMRSRGRSWIQI